MYSLLALPELPEQLQEVEERVNAIHVRLGALHTAGHRLEPADFKLVWGLRRWPALVRNGSQGALGALGEDMARMMDRLRAEKEEHERDIVGFQTQVDSFRSRGDLAQLSKCIVDAVNLDEALRAAAERELDFNRREDIFGWAPTDFEVVTSIQAQFLPYFQLWSTASDLSSSRSSWLTGPLNLLQPATVEHELKEWHSCLQLLVATFSDRAAPLGLAQHLLADTSAFMRWLPLVWALALRELAPRHWAQLEAATGVRVDPEDELTLQGLLDLGLMSHIQAVQAVGEVAEREHVRETALKEMEEELQQISYTVVPLHSLSTAASAAGGGGAGAGGRGRAQPSGPLMLGSCQHILSLLEDHTVKVQLMRGSGYIAALDDAARTWETTLLYARQLTEELLAVQARWKQLRPLFEGEDAGPLLGKQARWFSTVDQLWSATMQQVRERCCRACLPLPCSMPALLCVS